MGQWKVAFQREELGGWTGEAQDGLRLRQGGCAFKGNPLGTEKGSGTEPGPPVAP